ncbi:YcaO-like family protein [Streptomyces melanogenes]|uniref:YcaO-like family protein n=1 Tax=Streptomyces melanogenes TaxID=67326 RepID=UPI00379913DF
MHKVYFEGTHRTRHPAQTWQALRPWLPAYGITRVADVTGLDDLGIPVTMAVRPLARTLSVAQGKGASLDAARVSGAMEAIEAWHAEHAVPTAIAIHVPAREMALPYPVTALELHPGHLVTDRTRLDWITAECTVDGTPVPVPAACVALGRETHHEWRLHLPSASTNGLASGNTRAEAMAHGLCEIIERDVLSDLPPDADDREVWHMRLASSTHITTRMRSASTALVVLAGSVAFAAVGAGTAQASSSSSHRCWGNHRPSWPAGGRSARSAMCGTTATPTTRSRTRRSISGTPITSTATGTAA